jgi:threonine aldolase
VIDLRSDVHAPPTEEMWEAMRSAELGWATVGEDSSVNELQERTAGLLGKEAALWVPTCGMANLVALLTIAPRGSTVVLETSSHVLTSEAMGIEEVAGLVPNSLWAEDGRLDPAEVEELIVESGALMLVLENTHTRAGGTVLTPKLTAELARAAHSHGA